MKDILISKILPVISVGLLLLSLFLFFKMKQNRVALKTQNLLTHQFSTTNSIFKEISNNNYQLMKGMSDKRPDDSGLTEAIKQILQITEVTRTELEASFENNPSNTTLNQIIHQYKTEIDTLLEQFERENPIVTNEVIQSLKDILYQKVDFSNLLPTPLKKTIVLNGLNTNTIALTRFFPSMVSGNDLIYDKFQPIVSLCSRSLNTQDFKIYLTHPQTFSAKDLEIYHNEQPVPLVEGEHIIPITITDNTPDTTFISANYITPEASYASLSDTFSLTPSNH